MDLYVRLARVQLEQGLAAEALGLLTHLKEWVAEEGMQRQLNEHMLLCYLQLRLWDRVEVLARELIEGAADPSAPTLAWVALGVQCLQQSRYREAWLCAAHPIVYDRRVESADLGHAYLVATVATLRLGRSDLAARYDREREMRGLPLVARAYLREWLAEAAALQADVPLQADSGVSHTRLTLNPYPGMLQLELIPRVHLPGSAVRTDANEPSNDPQP
jgi:hypothetical protein